MLYIDHVKCVFILDLCHINILSQPSDIASFYKEALAGDLNTYVSYTVAATGQSAEEVLSDIVEEVTIAFERVVKFFDGEPQKDIWHRFATGFFCYHVYSHRYRLQELDIFQ